MRRYLLFLLALPLCAAPTVTVSATAQTLLGTNQTISLQVDLVDPNNTGLLRVNGTQIIPIMTASTVTPGATATVGPIYGNDVIKDGFGNLNSTYYRVRVFTVISNVISSTAAFQQFFAFTGAGTVDLATATPLAPSFMTGTSGSVSIPGNATFSGTNTFNGPLAMYGGSCTVASLQSAITTAAAAGGGIVDYRPCTTITTNITNATGPVAIPAKVMVLLGPAVWTCTISTANTPCWSVANTGKLLGSWQANVTQSASSRQGTVLRAGGGLGSTTDMVSVNPNPVAGAEGVEIGGLSIDFANTSSTTGRHCLSIFGTSNSFFHDINGANCGGDGVHVESTPYHSYDLTFTNVKMIAVGGQNGFYWTTGATITNIVGNGTTATITCVQLCPANGTSITVRQNSNAGFNVTATLNSSGGNTATFLNATNATGNGGFITYLGLADLDRHTCVNCVYYAYNAGDNVTRFGNYGFHIQAATSAPNCTAQNCNSAVDFSFMNGFSQGSISNASNAGMFLEQIGTITYLAHIYWQGEIEDSYQSNLGTGLLVASGLNTQLMNIEVRSAGFANYATQHNMSNANTWSYLISLTALAVPEFGTLQLRPQVLPGATTLNPNCSWALKSVASGTFCMYFASDGSFRMARTDIGPADEMVFQLQNNQIYSATDNGVDLGIVNNKNWKSLSTYRTNIQESSAPTGTVNNDTCYADSTAHAIRCSYNNGAFGPLVTAAPCTTSQKTETAADTNVLTCAIPAQTGSYRIRFLLSLSAANAATLGWTATWTDSNGSTESPTNLPLFNDTITGGNGSATPAFTFTTSTVADYHGDIDIDVSNAGTSIVVKLTFSGTSFTGKASATIERII